VNELNIVGSGENPHTFEVEIGERVLTLGVEVQ
jgi:hypothetical protein